MMGMMEEAGCYPVSSFLFIETWKTILNTGLEERKGTPIKYHWGVYKCLAGRIFDSI